MIDRYIELQSIKKLLEIRDCILNNKSYERSFLLEIIEEYFTDTLIFNACFGIDEVKLLVNFFTNFIFDYFKDELLKCNGNLLFQFIKMMDYYPHVSKMNLEQDIDIIDYLNIEIRKTNNDMILNDMQKLLHESILSKNQVIYSAPTSYGKTAICLDAFIELFKMQAINSILIIVPTKSLINEYRKNILYLIKKNNLNINIIENAYSNFKVNENNIYIFTQERTLVFFSFKERAQTIDYVLIDEAQAITSIKKKRTPLLLKAISLFDNAPKIFLTPLVKNFNSNIMQQLDSNNHYNEYVVTSNNSLVSNNKFIVDFVENQNKIIVYDVTFDKKKKLKEYSKEYNIENDFNIYLNSINLIMDVTNDFGKSIIFLTNRMKVMDWPKEILKYLQPIKLSKRMKALIKYLEKNIHKDFILIDYLRYGVAFHNGDLDNFTKRQIEYIFTNEDSIKYLFCTTTISQGVNLSARNIFMFITKFISDNPNLDFLNLLGRAARLGYNCIGNLFYMKQTKTSKYENLFLKSNSNLELDLPNLTSEDVLDSSNVELRSYLFDKDIKNEYKNKIFDEIIDKNDNINISPCEVNPMNYSIEQRNIPEIEQKIKSLSEDKLNKYIRFYQDDDITKEFISFLKDTYRWDEIYGINNKKKKCIWNDRKHRILYTDFIATIIIKLIRGQTINSIINDNIKDRIWYVDLKNKRISRNFKMGYVLFDRTNIDHINVMIINSLIDVHELIEFEVKKYIQDFYYRANKLKGSRFGDENIENFIDFTTIDKVKIKLLNSGVVDSFAINEIASNKEYQKFILDEKVEIDMLFERISEIEGDESPLYYAIKDIM